MTRELDAYAAAHGGGFTLFGSAARGEMDAGSDVDILLDFAADASGAAWLFAEGRAHALGLSPDIVERAGAGTALLAQIEADRQGRTAMARVRDLVDLAGGSAVRHFTAAIAIFAEGGLVFAEPAGCVRTMAFLHAMQAGHTSLESALQRLLAAHGVMAGTDASWHARLIVQAAADEAGRTAILPPEIAAAADETRRFRHVAMHSYDVAFDAARAASAVAAAALITAHLPALLAAALDGLDPERDGA